MAMPKTSDDSIFWAQHWHTLYEAATTNNLRLREDLAAALEAMAEWQRKFHAAVAEEREACAVTVESRRYQGSTEPPVTVKAANHALRLAAEAIRERP